METLLMVAVVVIALAVVAQAGVLLAMYLLRGGLPVSSSF